MSRKAFLIWGFVIISLNATLVVMVMYFSLSRVIDAKAIGPILGVTQLLIPVVGFGIILYLRFKEIGRRKRLLALCLLFYWLSLVVGSTFLLGSLMSDIFGAQDRLFGAIKDWAELADPKPASPFSTIRKLDYAIFSLPSLYLQNWGLFALLWFGSLDPRTPSKNGFTRFMKHGFQGKTVSKPSCKNSKPAVG